MVTEEEHETDEEHECHKHEEEDVKLCRPVGQVLLAERSRATEAMREGGGGVNIYSISSKAPNDYRDVGSLSLVEKNSIGKQSNRQTGF